MTEPENFLARWSRRKLDAKEPAAPTEAEAAAQKPAANIEEGGKDDATVGAVKNPGPAFDPASLPSLESIGAETDISAFLQAGVPGDLRLAALRRAWVSDPAIRDFKGLAENDWDFTVPNEAMGFGEIDPGLDVKKMLANVFGEAPRAESEAAEKPPAPDAHAAAQDEQNVTTESVPLRSDEVALQLDEMPPQDQHFASAEKIVQRNNESASSADDEDRRDDSFQKQKRRQGGALPQ